MINIKEIKYTVDPIEINEMPDDYNWSTSQCKAWFGLSEISSIPSLFIERKDSVIAISIQNLKTLLNLPAAHLLDTDMSKTTQG